MGAPYVSIRRLVDNSISAMLAAVEIYNKPRMTYRDEVTVMLIVNAWELAFKAALRQKRKSIFYPKKPGQRYLSVSIDDALGRVNAQNLWPNGIDGMALTTNIKSLTEFRDRAVHLYNAAGLGAMMHPFLQQNVLNYRDFMLARFKKDLADSMTWQLLPLGATAPADAVQFMKPATSSTMASEVEDFIDTLRALMDEAQAKGADMDRVAAIYDIHLQSHKKMTSADLVVAVSPTADGQIAIQKTDPNQTHPYSATELIERANRKRKGRALNHHDLKVACWKFDLREDKQFAWKHGYGATHVWSGEAVKYFADMPDEQVKQLRAEYKAWQRQV